MQTDDAVAVEHRQLRHVVELHPRIGDLQPVVGRDRHRRAQVVTAADQVAQVAGRAAVR